MIYLIDYNLPQVRLSGGIGGARIPGRSNSSSSSSGSGSGSSSGSSSPVGHGSTAADQLTELRTEVSYKIAQLVEA